MDTNTALTKSIRGMRIKPLLLVLLLAIAGEAQADVFGLKKGMTIEQIRALKFGELTKIMDTPEQFWEVRNPKTPKDAQIATFVLVPGKGLLKVAFLWRVDSNTYGDGVKEKFNKLRTILSEKYGKGETIDYLKEESQWAEPHFWMQTLADKERVLQWALIGGITKNELANIGLSVMGSTPFVGYISLFYEFEGWPEHVAEKEKKEASDF